MFALYVRKLLISLFSLLFLSSCINENIDKVSDDIIVTQSFSLPLGPKQINIPAPSVRDTSSIAGTYGSFYYNEYIYPNNYYTFVQTKEVNFNLESKNAKAEWIKKLEFSILIENAFPTRTYSQIYQYNDSNVLLDSMFVDGRQSLNAADLNDQGEIINSTAAIYSVSYEDQRLNRLRQTSYLLYKVEIETLSAGSETTRFSDKNFQKFNVGARILLQYNIQDINK